MANGQSDRGHGIAIIGMAGRFPGASGVEPFWENLTRGVESITRFSTEQLRAAGVEAELAADPAYVPARGIVEGAELFDAAFFGTGAREAEVLDPQHRLLLEIAWEALERAGHDPHRFSGPIGVFAGAGINTYLLSNLQHNPEVVAAAGEYQAMLGSGGDFLATRISYHLGLRGPSLAVQTACSTSLVAVHLAVQSLLGGECDMALAGGVRLTVPRQAGHLFQPGGIFSPDGHCRPFDAAAAGIVEGEGAGLVVLRRLADALADGDHVHAVIVGSAVNNDGSFKLGYTAPSIDGQAEVVAMAQALAGIDPATIAFVEAHGTGTPLGDPIEVAALARAFAAGGGGERRIACALGSVKGNIGHLDAAAGVASLIKAALAVEHGLIPPSLHFEHPNPQIDFGSGAFYVPQQPVPWPAAATAPRRAGVSSFGIGGTNAHLVLEQAPEAAAAPAATARPRQLVILSARTEAALEAATANLADHLLRRPETDLAAVASTLQLGRVAFDRRRIAVCDHTADAAGLLAALDPKRVLTRTRAAGERAVVFLFPGQGTQHPGMGAELYRCEPTFRAQVDLGAEILRPRLGLDLRGVLYPAGGERDTRDNAAAERLAQTAMAQPALFVVEHALAQLWLEWGVRPQAMLGHSLGEYVAACLAGVWPFEEALRLVCERARLVQELPGGSMLAVPLPEAEVVPLLGGLSLAAVNGPALCVVSGAAGEVEDLSSRLRARGVEVRRLHTSHAFHSAAMDPILPRFAAALAGLPARPPRVPFLSNLTGTWIRPEEAVDPSYWARQLRETVRFAAGLEQLFARPSAALLEVGPGRALTSLARRHPRRPGAQAALASLPAPGDDTATAYGTMLRSLGQLWLGGYEVDWAGFHRGRSTRRAILPTYPFERQRYWVEPLPGAAKARRRRARTSEIADWFWVPVWRREPLVAAAPAEAIAAGSWLVLGDAAGFGGRLAARLREQGRDVAMAGAGDRFEPTGADDFVLRPGEEADYGALLDRLAEQRRVPARIVHAWCAGPAAAAAREQELGFFGLVRLARALAARRPPDSPPLHLGIVSTGVQRIAAEADLQPIRATLLGPAATIPQELAGVTCQAVDVDLPTAGSAWEGRLLDALIAELAAAGDAPIVAYRGLDRWLRDVAPWQQPPPAPALPPPGATWLITGGLGGVGLEIAALLARQAGTKLVLTSRQPFPDKAAWSALAQGEGRDSRVARRLLDLETAGAEVWVAQADVTDAAALRRAVDLAHRHCGRIQGAVHAAGVAGGGLMARRSLEEMSAVLAPKVQGTLLLAELLAEDPPDLLVLCSSLNALFGGPGQADYAAANAFLDAFAQSQCGRMPVLSIDWDAWRGIGMAAAPFGLAAAPHQPRRPAASRAPETPRAPEAPPVGELQPFVHPLLKERGVRGDGAEVFVGRLRPGDSWIVDDHRLGGMPVMPGTAYLEMAGAAFREMAAATGAIEMRDVVFVSPMGLDDGQTREFQALLRRNGDGFHFTVQSREGADWTQHIIGTVGAAPGVAPAAIDLASLAGGGWEEVTLGEAYREDLRVAGLGPRWEVLRKVYRRPGEAVGLLELAPEFAADVEELALHPAMLDVATGFAELFLRGAAAGGYYLPLSYKRIRVLGALPSRVYSHARLRTQELDGAETLAFDITILDASGVPRMGIEEFVIKRVDVAAALRRRAGRGAAAVPPGAEDAERRQLAGGGDGMAPEQAAEALRRILAAVPLPQIAVSVRPLPELLAWGRALTAGRLAERAGHGAAGGHPRPDLDTPFVAPRSELEERMAAAWREVLGLDQVGVMDDFFELGGHSLLGTQLLSRVRETFGVEVPLAKLFTAATVADLAADVAERLTGSGPAAPDEIPRLPRDRDLPLSFAQERIWFLDRLDRRNSFYNVSQAIRLEGPLEVAPLSRAFSEIVRRHEVLHSAFVEVDGQPAQRVLPALPLPLPVAELSALPESRREAAAERLAIAVTRRSFDLAQPPLLAVQLARLAPRRHVLVLTLHHIVADGWSIQVILAELGALYGAFLAGRQSPLAELPIQYADFAAWQRASFEKLDLDEQLAYWRRQLAPPLPRLELPLDRPRPAIQTYRGRADFLVLPAELVTALKALCHREGATPFMALLAVLSLLLGRWSGQRDLLIGSPIAGRDRREVEGLIGIFLNTLVLRCDLSGAPTFRELLGRMRETALQAYARQGVPIEKLIEELRPERDPSRAALFQVLFNMQDFPRVDRKLPGLELTSLPLREVASKFDLTTYAAEVDGEILFELVSNADLFEPATAHALLDQLRHLVTLATTSPDEHIDRYSLVAAESAAVLADRCLPLPARVPFATPLVPPPPRPPDGRLPLSFAQERLWFMDRFEPGGSAFNLPLVVRLEGPLQAGRLRLALDAVVARHEILRTTFDRDAELPFQRVAPAVLGSFPLPRIDLAGLAERPRREALAWLAAAHRGLRFDLARGPLLSAWLLRLAPHLHTLLLNIHNIVADGWSMGILGREISTVYDGSMELAELPLQYADFAGWQRRRLGGGELAADLAYWRERLAGEAPPLELPLDRQRPPVQVFAGDVRGSLLAPALVAELAALGRRHGASSSMVILAGFQVLLQRLSGQRDLVLGTPITGRTRPETEELIGCFLNTLVLRTDLSGAPSFADLLERVREVCHGAYDHQELPFETLLEALAPDRDLSRTPLFQVCFDMLDLPPPALRLAGIEVEVDAGREPPAKFDLTLYLQAAGGGIALRAVYNAVLLAPARIEEMLRQLECLLAQAAAAPERSIDDLSTVSDAARQVLPDPALPLSPAWRGAVHDIFARLAAEQPQRTALVESGEGGEGGDTWTYGELESAANRLAHYLLAAGLRPGERVAIYAHRSAPLAAAVLAALKAGGCFLLLDPAHPAERQVALLDDAAPRCWLQLAAAGPPPGRLAERVLGLTRLTLPALGRWQAWPPLAQHPPTPPAVTVGADDPACLTFTSGSTGRPKGVLGRHGPLSHFIAWQQQVFGMSAADRFSLLSGLAHDPLQRDLFTPLQLGATICIPDPERILEPGWLAAWMAERQVTVAHLTPAMGQVIATGRPGEVPSLRLALLVGDVLTRRDVARLRQVAPAVTCVNLYGATETQRAVGFYVSPPPAPADAAEISGTRQVLPLGRGVEDVQLLVLAGLGTAAGARLAGIGELGEICVRSPHLALGYLGDQQLTAERFLVNPFTSLAGDRLYRTGDLGRYLPAGDVAFAGRADNQVKVRGYRIELGEIEATLALHPALREAAVVLRDDGREPYIAAYLVAKRGRLDVEDVRAFLRRRLPEFMLPQTWTVLAALPLTPNRKLDRRALPLPRREAAAAPAGPRGPLEEMLASLWCELLGVEQVGLADDFFAVGGHSLLATRLLARIGAAFGVEVPLRQLFQTPTFAATARAIAEQLRAGLGSAAPPLVRRPAGEAACLSFGQQRLWFLDRLQPGDVSYNLPAVIRIEGDFEVDLAAACLSAVVRRHEALRTRFREEDGSPRAVIAEPAPVPLPEVDLYALPAARAAALARRLAQDQLRLPFDLANGPLLRACLVRLRTECLLVFSVHHIAADGWSLGLLRRELALLYAMAAASRPSPLPALPLQYADFASWQRRFLSGEVLAAQLAYWREQLANAPPALEVPADRPRRALPSSRGGRQRRRLTPGLTGRLARLAQRETATLFMVLVAGWQTLLARWSGQPEVVVGTPVANRPRRELEGLIGFFANTLVLRARVNPAESFRELLAQVRETALGAYTHQDLPFEQLVEALAPERSLERTPLFQVLVALQQVAGGQAVSLRDLTFSEVEVDTGAVQFDLGLYLVAGEGELSLSIAYAADLFDGTTSGRLLDRLEALLEAVAAAPERRLSEQPWLPPAEVHQLLHEWNDQERRYGADRSLAGLLREQAARQPAAVALEWESEEVSYGDLAGRALKLAAELRRLGVAGGSRVGVCMERSLELVVALQGVLEAGGCYVPLDPCYPPARLQWMAADAGVEVLLTQPHLAVPLAVPDVPVVELAAGWGAGGEPVGSAPAPPVSVAEEPAGEEAAYVIYTSGSTGRPKGVMVPQRGIVNRLRWMQEAFGLGPADCVLQKTPFSFDVSVWEFFWPVLAGARLVVCRPGGHQDARYLVELMARSAVTVVHFVPSMLPAFLAQPDLERLRALRLVVLSGEALSAELAAALLLRLPWVAVWNLYGPTEAAVDVTAWRCAPDWGTRPVPIGRPIANTRIVVLERWADGLGMAGLGVPGELAIGGVQLARGYLGRPELTAERFVPDPFGGESGGRWYRTGDLARTLADGTVEYLGRLDHQVKVRGFRIELGEIEAALRGHPAVAEAVVTAPAAATGERRLVAYLVARPGEAAPAVEPLRAFVAARLPEYMLPAQLVWLEALPLSPNGKVDRQALPAPTGTRPQVEQRYVAPRNPVEDVLALLFAELLDVDRVGIHDGFFTLGGDSLLAVQLVSRAGRALALELPLRALFAAPTVAQLAAAVAPGGTIAAGGAAPPDIAPVSRDQPLPLSFAQSRLWLLQELDPQSPAYNLPAALGVDGALDAAALTRALSRLVERHEALRTVFPAPGGQPVQRVLAPWPLRLPRVDLARLPAAARPAAWRSIAFVQASRPFDLARGPLLRVALVTLAPAESILLFTLHHIVTDGWSTALLARELGELYRSAVSGEAEELPALPIQVPDFAVWQRRWLAGEAFAHHLEYWRRQLAGYAGVLELPADRPRPAVQSLRGARWPVHVPAGIWGSLAARCRAETITPFMCLLAGFAALLGRVTGRLDLAIGTAVANRTRPELESLVGCFVNALVLRLDLDGDPRFRQLAARAREVVIEAAMHQEMPFERLVEELAPPRDRSRSPLFQVMLTLQSFRRAEVSHEGLVFRQLETGNGTAKFDLELLAWEEAGELTGYLEYSTDLFDASSMARLAGHLGMLLAGAAAEPDRHLSALPLLTAAERCQLLLEHNDSDRPLPPAAGAVLELLAQRAAETPAATAVTCGDERQSYAQLEASADLLARRLAGLGVAAETLVGCFVERGTGLLDTMLAIWKAGGAYLPLDPQHPARRLGEVIRQSAVEVVVTSRPMQAALAEALASIAPIASIPSSAAAAPLPRVVLLEELLAPGMTADDRAPRGRAPGALAYVIFTSGSTGLPKGAMIEHRGMMNHLLAKVRDLGLHAGDVVAQTASQCFDVSLWQLLAPLLAGGEVQILDDATVRDPALLAGAVESGGTTVLEVVPSQLRALLADLAGKVDRPAFARLRWLVATGETLPATLCADWQRLYPAVRLVNAYGPTECSDDVTHQVIVRPPDDGAVPIGRPIANTRLYVVGRHGSLLPLGAPGELWAAGPAVGRGYRGDAPRTAEAFVPDPFAAQPGERAYRTGDRARWRADGALDLLGRLDQQVKVRGYRVETGDLEAALGDLPQLAAAAAGTCLGPGGEVQLVAYVVPRGAALDVESVRRGLRARLPEYMLPAAWVTLAALPLTPNGKLDRRALPVPPRPAAEAAGQAPATAAEAALAAIWAEVLGVEQVSRDDDFFTLGGHSLLAARIAARVRAVLGAELAMRQVFETPVLWQQAAALSDAVAGAGAAPPLAAWPRPAHPPLSFAQERLWLIDQAQPGDTSYNIPRAVRLRGALDLPALGRVLTELVRRHQALRTTFPLAEDLPYQRVAPPRPWPLPVADLAPLPEAARDRELARLTRQQVDSPFDLARGPVWRTLLVRREAADHVLFVTFHHIASDGWSLVVLVREIAALYEAFAGGSPSPLPEPSLHYVDYALWQRQWLRGAALDQLLGFWTRQLRGPLPALRLPFDRPEGPPGPPRAGFVRIAFPPALSGELLAFCRRERTTPFLVLLAAFAELLRLDSAADEVLIGAPFAGRSRLELEGLLGPFLNTVVLRIDLAGDPDFRELLRRVREVVLGAEAHQHLPFEKLVHALGRHDAPASSSLYQGWFNFQELPPAVSPRGLQVESLPLEPRYTKFDLALNLAVEEGEIGGTLEFSRDRFDHATIERLGRGLQWLAAQSVEQPCLRLQPALEQLAAKERDHRSSAAQEAKSAFRARLDGPRRRRPGSPMAKGVT